MVGVLAGTRRSEPFGLGTTENPPILPVMRRFLLLVAGIACLAACKKEARVTGKPVTSPELHLRLEQGFHEAYDAAILLGARDWSEYCQTLYGFIQDTKEPQYKQYVRHFDLPNGILIDLFFRSKQEMVLGSEEWDSATFDQSVVSCIGVINSRMLRSMKSSIEYGVRDFYQNSQGKTLMSGFDGESDSHFLHVGMPVESALRLIAEQGLTLTSANDSPLKPILVEINQLRHKPGFELPADLLPGDRWQSMHLPGDALLFIRIEKSAAEDLIKTMVYSRPGGIKELKATISDNPTSVEVEVFNMVTAALCPKWGE